MADNPTYTIISQVKVNRWNNDRQTTESGWEVTARWASTGTVLPVFVTDEQYNPTNVDAAIRSAGQVASQVAALGG